MIDSKTLYEIIHKSYYHPSFMTNAFYIDVYEKAMYVTCVYADENCSVKSALSKQRKMPWDKFKVDDTGQFKRDVLDFMNGDIICVVHSNGNYK